MSNVSFLGTGLIGGGMVERMLRQGTDVTVWNRTAAKARALEPLGARVAESPEGAVAGAGRVHIALQDDKAVDEVLERVAGALRSGTIVIDHSTTSPEGAGRRMGALTSRGVRFLHAPVFMSPEMCREGKGLMLVSGPQAEFDAVRETLAKMTGHVWYLGARPDLAAAYKLFGNAMLLVIVGGFADVFTMARAAEIAPQDALSLLSKFQAWIGGSVRGERMARGDFEPAFALSMARKDVRLMIEMAGGAPLAMLPGLAARMDEAIAAGRGGQDVCAIGAVDLSTRQTA